MYGNQKTEVGDKSWKAGIDIHMLLLLLLSHSVVSDSVRPHRQQPTRLPRPWDSPGKNMEWVAISFSSA